MNMKDRLNALEAVLSPHTMPKYFIIESEGATDEQTAAMTAENLAGREFNVIQITRAEDDFKNES
ncbi:MAG: hypothetical protein QX198_15560 [Methylococcaceae bacterium]